ncbi:polycomb group RING finger protein 6 [Amia ocellicauda]|uniref:polycomb group RING finger protein 6 n=1 Tax=Amia ocellicauda TaxID=2972642 RepID=UPI003463F2F5
MEKDSSQELSGVTDEGHKGEPSKTATVEKGAEESSENGSVAGAGRQPQGADFNLEAPLGGCENDESDEESVAYGGDSGDDHDERTLPLSEVFPYIRCTLCDGYFIDATTITECLHTFCKSCIVKHFFYSNRCPNCNVVVHQTQPLYNIRLDRQLQDIVYKMVPHLEEKERTRMHEFYKERGLEVPKPAAPPPSTVVKASKQKKGLLPQSVFSIPPEMDVSLLLEFVGAEEGIDNYKPLERKYVRVSGEATIRHVELFIRRKMELNPGCQVDVVCGDHLLDRYQSLREVQNTVGDSALQDGLLVLHFGLVLPPGYKE